MRKSFLNGVLLALLPLLGMQQNTMGKHQFIPASGGVTQPCSGSPCVDNFNRGNGVPLPASWTTNAGLFNSYGLLVYGDTPGDNLAFYNAGSFIADQASCLTISSPHSATYIGMSVRTASLGTTAYVYPTDLLTAQPISRGVSGAYTALGSSVLPTAGDELCLSAVGSTITLKDITTSTVLSSVTDSVLATGSPGLYGFNNALDPVGQSWIGYNCPYAGVC